jgi:uncharacterized protein (TIGR00251 family)
MLQLTQTSHGVLLLVKAQPGAWRRGIVGLHAGALKIAVTEPPEKGKANRAIIEVLCESLGLHATQIEFQSGETSKLKKLIVRDIAVDELQRRVNVVIADQPSQRTSASPKRQPDKRRNAQ